MPEGRPRRRSLSACRSRAALAVITETLAVATEAERHAGNRDRKTGGSAFPSAGTTGP